MATSTRRDDRGPALPLVLAICLSTIAIGGYALLGNPAALAPPPSAAAAAATEPEVTGDQVAAMVDTLAARLDNRPATAADLQGWIMLGRSYAALQRFDAAAKAYARALDLTPDDPQLLADRADMLAMQQGQRLSGEPDRLIQRALALDPKQLKALALAGSAAFERQRWDEAAGYWRRARALVGDGSELAQGLDRSLAEAATAADREGRDLKPNLSPAGADRASAGAGRASGLAPAPVEAASRLAQAPVEAASRLAQAPVEAASRLAEANTAARSGRAENGADAVTSPAGTDSSSTPPTASPDGATALAGTIAGSVRLSPALAGRVVPGDTVFVFARAAEGPRMPLAILRRAAADLPLDFRLDDSLAMSPALKLSSFSRVVVGVRVSRSGQAMPQPGDLIGEAPATPGGAPVQITIDRVQP